MSGADSGLRVLAFEGFYTASHRAFLDGLIERSRHRWELLALPGRRWRQRMLSGAEELARRAAEVGGDFDVLFATDMLDLADLARRLPEGLAGLPRVLYFHENQLTYPLRPGAERDPRLCAINVTGAMAADLVLFNSEFHRADLLAAVPGFLEAGGPPDLDPRETVATIAARSAVVHPGIDVAGISSPERDGPLRVLWNHRWEYDKRPEAFFEALTVLDRRGADFRIIVCGEQFSRQPPCFERARRDLGARIEHFGFAESSADYRRLLGRADVGVSTAAQESFGIAALEACAAGCMPLLPARLSYPELIPEGLRPECLYGEDAELPDRLERLASDPRRPRLRQARWRAVAERFAWPRQAGLLDSSLEALARLERSGQPPIDRLQGPI